MSNILNHNRVLFNTKINRKELWDFCLSLGNQHIYNKSKDNAIVDIDLNQCDTIWFNELTSTAIWSGAINNGVNLTNIGYNGVDNGFITYDKSMITNNMFLEKFLKSKYVIEKDDLRLHLQPINGNNKLFDYTCNIKYDNDIQVIECNGGFYQGFWKTKDGEYNLLPDISEGGLCFEFNIKPCDLENTEFTLNKCNPNNKGIFFYMGTRSENKWWKYYDIEDNFEKSITSYFYDDYIKNDYHIDDVCVNYIKDNTAEELLSYYIKNNGYLDSEYMSYTLDDFDSEIVDECKSYFADDYIEEDVKINETELINSSEDYLNEPHKIKEIVSDNKFLLFDHTKDGFTTKNWEEGTKLIIEQEENTIKTNYFLLFNHTKDGYTVKDFDKLKKDNPIKYDVLSDLYQNAIGFRITDNGEVGYKYMVKDCENNTYKILTEYTYPNTIKKDEWSTIHILIIPQLETMEMIVKIYINNKLKLVSKNLPILKFRQLNDDYKKQEGVPFSISLGGGTQGLCDVVYPNYMKQPEYRLPIEKEFAGSFIGYIKSFKIYNNITNIQELLVV